MSSRFVNPFTDLGFKIIFGQPASKDLLIILLNELLSGEHHIPGPYALLCVPCGEPPDGESVL
jgi:hypothetical protein